VCFSDSGNVARAAPYYESLAMKTLCGVLLQLCAFCAWAGTTSTSLLVTVTVVRPAPVASTSSSSNVAVANQSEHVTPNHTVETNTPDSGVRYVTIIY